MAATDPQRQLLTLIRDFASEKSQGERRVVGLEKRIVELGCQLDAANAEMEEVKRFKENTELELKGYEFQLAFNDVSIQTLEARISMIQDEISSVGSEVEGLKDEEGASRDEFIRQMFELNTKISGMVQSCRSDQGLEEGVESSRLIWVYNLDVVAVVLHVEKKLRWFELVVVVFYLGLFVVDLGHGFGFLNLPPACKFGMYKLLVDNLSFQAEKGLESQKKSSIGTTAGDAACIEYCTALAAEPVCICLSLPGSSLMCGCFREKEGKKNLSFEQTSRHVDVIECAGCMGHHCKAEKKVVTDVDLRALKDVLAHVASQIIKEEQEYLAEENIQKQVQKEHVDLQRKVSLVDVIVKETEVLQDLTRYPYKHYIVWNWLSGHD
ncbi:hypothetical protein POTOM_006290 [Populus tomentosa]|uniref:Uncharacterized protein n=1 Tax=Populus tomentosa TaxID=118781 RepID=A0A8X8ANZ7_POPTO|nr:hypothetical protein POTOM_006290 [Populus tomentosa]